MRKGGPRALPPATRCALWRSSRPSSGLTTEAAPGSTGRWIAPLPRPPRASWASTRARWSGEHASDEPGVTDPGWVYGAPQRSSRREERTMDVVAMTSELISFNSTSQRSNLEITDYLERALRALEFEVERLEYRDDHGD